MLVLGSTEEEAAHWGLPAAAQLHYLNQGGAVTRNDADAAHLAKLKVSALRYL